MEEIEVLISVLTNPIADHIGQEEILKLNKAIKNHNEGPQKALMLIAHKIQSPNCREALNALMVLDSCLQSADSRFLSEFGKFKFLNEVIKVLSPKYLGDKTPFPVKEKCKEMILTWRKDYGTKEPKINQVFDLLVDQNVFDKDDTLERYNKPNDSPVNATRSIIEDSNHSIELAKLLRSKNPIDLKKANQMIQDAVNKENLKQERRAKHRAELDTARNNAKLLAEMLETLNNDETVTTSSDHEIITQLVEMLKQAIPHLNEIANSEYDDQSDQHMLTDLVEVCDLANGSLDIYEKYRSSARLIDAPVIVNGVAGDRQESLIPPLSPVTSTEPFPVPSVATVDILSQDLDLLDLDFATTPTVTVTNQTELLMPNADAAEVTVSSRSSNGLPGYSQGDWDSLRNLQPIQSVFHSVPSPAKHASALDMFQDLDTLSRQMLTDMKEQHTSNKILSQEVFPIVDDINEVDLSVSDISDPVKDALSVYNSQWLRIEMSRANNRYLVETQGVVSHGILTYLVSIHAVDTRADLTIKAISFRLALQAENKQQFKLRSLACTGDVLNGQTSRLLKQIVLLQMPHQEKAVKTLKLRYQLCYEIPDDVIMDSGQISISI